METREAEFDFESFFRDRYQRIARAVARVVGDPARAEDLAVEAFWKLWRTPQAHGENAGGWVYRTALRLALNDLRRDRRRNHRRRQRWKRLFFYRNQRFIALRLSALVAEPRVRRKLGPACANVRHVSSVARYSSLLRCQPSLCL